LRSRRNRSKRDSSPDQDQDRVQDQPLVSDLSVSSTSSTATRIPYDRLRPSLITSIYSLLPPSLRASLSRRTNLSISKVFVSQGETSLIPPIFHHLSRTTTWEPEGVWTLLSLILALTRHHAIEEAIPLLHNLVANNRLPASSLIGKGLSGHPEAKTLIVQTLILRTCLEYRFYGRARIVALEVAETLKRSRNSEPAWNLLLETIRVMLVGGQRKELVAVKDIFISMARVTEAEAEAESKSGSPTASQEDSETPIYLSVPSSLLNTYFVSIPPSLDETLNHAYSNLRHSFPAWGTKLSSTAFLRLASVTHSPLLLRIKYDLEQGYFEEGAEACKPALLRYMVRAGLRRNAVRLKRGWDEEKREAEAEEEIR
jgi:hypothetical protein